MPAVNITIASPAPDDCPQTFSELVALFRELITATVDSGTSYLVQSDTPSVDQQDLIWHRLDSIGRPIGTYKFYDGGWRREYANQIGDIKIFSGDPTLHFDGDGKGIAEGLHDGWQLCNGENGSINLSDKFIIGAHMDNSGGTDGYASGWRSTITGDPLSTGGGDVTLDADTTYRPARAELKLSRWHADSPGERPNGEMYGTSAGTPGAVHDVLLAADAGNTTPTAIPIIPVHYALAFCQFTGY